MKHRFHPGIAVLSFLLLPLSSGSAQPFLIAEEAWRFAVLNDTEVLISDRDGNFQVVDVTDPGEVSSWDPGWDPTDSGWERATSLVSLTVSPDGNWVCFARFVTIPEELLREDEMVPSPLAVVISPFYGNRAWLAALAMEVGGGPGFDFTMDSMNLYGQPFISCETRAEDYLAWLRGETEGEEMDHFTIINLLSGERSGSNINMNDGYVACPWSDLVAVDDMYLEMIADMSTGEIVYEVPSGSGYIEVDKWVTEDALLVETEEGQALLYSDGTLLQNPNDWSLEVYCRSPQGAYLFSTDHGSEVKFGNIDWTRFQPLEAVSVPALSGELSRWDLVLPMQDGSGIVYYSYDLGGLAFFPAPSR